MRWNLTWLANDIMLWVPAFSWTAVGNLHNNSGIRCFKALWALEVRNRYRCERSWLLVWISYSSWLYLNMEAKYVGTLLFTNLCQNFMHCTSKIFLIVSNFKLLNSGSVCAFYLLLVIILIARFCNFCNGVQPSCWWLNTIRARESLSR